MTLASASGTEGEGGVAGVLDPPFCDAGISEWHGRLTRLIFPRAGRHSVTLASASGTAKNEAQMEYYINRHSVTLASASGTSPVARPLSWRYRHSVTLASASGTT